MVFPLRTPTQHHETICTILYDIVQIAKMADQCPSSERSHVLLKQNNPEWRICPFCAIQLPDIEVIDLTSSPPLIKHSPPPIKHVPTRLPTRLPTAPVLQGPALSNAIAQATRERENPGMAQPNVFTAFNRAARECEASKESTCQPKTPVTAQICLILWVAVSTTAYIDDIAVPTIEHRMGCLVTN